MKTSKSSVFTARDFFQLTVNTLLELCTHCIDGQRIVNIEGRLLLTLDTGDQVELNILQQDVGSLSAKSDTIKADDTNKSCLNLSWEYFTKSGTDARQEKSNECSNLLSFGSDKPGKQTVVATSDVDKNIEDVQPQDKETHLMMEDSTDTEILNSVHKQQDGTLYAENEADFHSSYADDGEQSFPDADSVPTAVLQRNGDFVCSSCGESTKCARTIKRHIETHLSLQLLGSSATSQVNTYDVGKEIIQKQPNAEYGGYKKMPRLSVSTDNSRRFQKPNNNKDGAIRWRSYPCKDCDELFTSSSLVQFHRVQMHKPHQCQKCGMVLPGRRNFSHHVRTEHPGQHICKAQKSFMCEYCSRTFHDETYLKDHISTVHLGSVEHRCDQCGKVLGSAITLQIHQRQLHERRFLQTCDGCGRQFTRFAGLINHLTRTHPHLLPDKYRQRLDEFACQECDLKFLRRTSLQQHLEIRHGGLPKYVCPVCSRRFSCRRYVFRHVRIHHPGNVDTASGKRSAMVVKIDNDNNTSDMLHQTA